MLYTAATIVFMCLSFVSASVSQAAVVQTLYSVHRGLGLSTSILGSNLKAIAGTTTESVCALTCAAQGCCAAQYDSSGQCKLAFSQMLLFLVQDTTKRTYVSGSALSEAVQPLVYFPLSSNAAQGYATNLGYANLSNTLTVVGPFTTVTNTGLLVNNTLWYPSATNTFPVTSTYVSVQDTSTNYNLHMFNGSFSVALFLRLPSSPPADMPLVEFLGASYGQRCAHLRVGCYGSCANFYFNSDCSCSPSSTLWITANGNLALAWSHLAVTYNAEAKALRLYLDGTTIYNAIVNPQMPSGTVTRLLFGASECSNYWFNTLSGSLACFQLYNVALTDSQVAASYRQCQQSGAIVLPNN